MSNWKNWGDHPFPVLVGTIASLCGIIAFITSISPQTSSTTTTEPQKREPVQVEPMPRTALYSPQKPDNLNKKSTDLQKKEPVQVEPTSRTESRFSQKPDNLNAKSKEINNRDQSIYKSEEELSKARNKCKWRKLADTDGDCNDGRVSKPVDTANLPYSIRELDCVLDAVVLQGILEDEFKLLHPGRKDSAWARAFLNSFKPLNSINISRCPKDFRDSFNNMIDLISDSTALINKRNTRENKIQLEESINSLVKSIREYNVLVAKYSDIIDESGNQYLQCKIEMYKMVHIPRLILYTDPKKRITLLSQDVGKIDRWFQNVTDQCRAINPS